MKYKPPRQRNDEVKYTERWCESVKQHCKNYVVLIEKVKELNSYINPVCNCVLKKMYNNLVYKAKIELLKKEIDELI